MAKLKTHFEQIPISAVKKIAEKEAGESRDMKSDELVIDRPRQKMEPYSVRTNSHAGN